MDNVMSWAQNLFASLEGFNSDEIKTIKNSPVKPEEECVGTAPEFTKKLHTMGLMMSEMSDRTTVESKYCDDPDRRRELADKAALYAFRSKILNDLMWLNLRETFDIPLRIGIGLRDDFQVVKMNRPPLGNMLQDLLGDLLKDQ